MIPTSALSVQEISVSFGGIDVLSDVSLDIKAGEIHGLIGENGAGKSTLGKVLGGYYQAARGTINSLNETQTVWDTPNALRNGVAIMHQELQLVPTLTVAQNVFLGLEENRAGYLRGTENQRLKTLMDECGLMLNPDEVTSNLTIAAQQKIEILRALARKARVIVMDEPTSSLSKSEVDQLHQIMRSLRDEGRTVIYVTHFLDDILEVSDRVTVLRNGRLIHTQNTIDQTKQSLVSAMLGDNKTETIYPPKQHSVSERIALSVRKLRAENGSDVPYLDIREGEIIGLTGLVGSGRSEIARAILGIDPAIGVVCVNGTQLQHWSVSGATQAGMVLVPENRRKQGLVMTQSVAANVSLPHLAQLSIRGIINRNKERSLAQRIIDRFSIRPSHLDGDIAHYSGGNQQKILLGKWLAGEPSVVILDEPTRGVDVGARETIHKEIAELAASGTAILLISSVIEEVLGLAHRAFIVDRGKLVQEFNPDEFDEKAVLSASFYHQTQSLKEAQA